MSFRILFLILFSSNLMAQAHLKNIPTKADSFAWAKQSVTSTQAIWPYEVESIGHSMQSFQQYDYTSAYWHDGLDMRAAAGTKVYASISGIVVNIENYYSGDDLYWEVAILDDQGLVWKYHHVDKDTIPLKIHKAYKNKTRIAQGEYLGEIVKWPVSSFGERFHHIHMLVIDGHGRYINPLNLLPLLFDDSAPVIKEIGLFDQKRRLLKGNTVRGKHGIYVNTFDTILHSRFRLTPYKISYRLDGGDEKLVWKFDSLPSVNNDSDYIYDFYLGGTCGNYNCKNFNINLNFDVTEQLKATRYFELAPGKHFIEVYVRDFYGNENSKTFSYQVSP